MPSGVIVRCSTVANTLLVSLAKRYKTVLNAEQDAFDFGQLPWSKRSDSRPHGFSKLVEHPS